MTIVLVFGIVLLGLAMAYILSEALCRRVSRRDHRRGSSIGDHNARR